MSPVDLAFPTDHELLFHLFSQLLFNTQVAKYQQHLQAEYGDMKYCHLQISPLFKVIS